MDFKTLPIFQWMLISTILFNASGCKAPLYSSDGNQRKKASSFSIAVIPDTQYYTGLFHGGKMEMFEDQISWVRANKETENIAYVVHLGDITQKNADDEWVRAKTELYKLEEDKIAYGLSIGNHDQVVSSSGIDYTTYFSAEHFKDKPWFGGSMDSDNRNHFDLFDAGGESYIVIYFDYNEPKKFDTHRPEYEKKAMNWADSILSIYPKRSAILVSHSMLGRPAGSNSDLRPGTGNNEVMADFTSQGQVIYNMAKTHENVFMMLGGHVGGEGFRVDDYKGHIIRTYLSDYQFRRNSPYETAKDNNGGNGMMRLMKFDNEKKIINFSSFSPLRSGTIKEEDGDSRFTMPIYK